MSAGLRTDVAPRVLADYRRTVETLIEPADTSTRLPRVGFEPCATIGASFTTKWGLMATFDDVVRLCADLPGVTVSTSYGTPALKLCGNGFCRL